MALALGCSMEQVLEALDVAASYEALSLDAPAARDGDEAARLVDLLGDEDAAYRLVESRDAIASIWGALPKVERKVVELRFVHDLTQREIGEQIGCSQMQVSRLLQQALARLEQAAAAAERALGEGAVVHAIAIAVDEGHREDQARDPDANGRRQR